MRDIVICLEVDLINKIFLSHILEILFVNDNQSFVGNATEFPLLSLEENQVFIDIELFRSQNDFGLRKAPQALLGVQVCALDYQEFWDAEIFIR